jgi:hypothetical protein
LDKLEVKKIYYSYQRVFGAHTLMVSPCLIL